MPHQFAYIDPGLGTLLWQSIIGVIVGMFFYLRKIRKWIGTQLRKILPDNHKPADPAPTLPLGKDKMPVDPS